MSSFRWTRHKCQNLGFAWRRKKKLCSNCWLDFDTKSVKHFNGDYLNKSCWVDFADDKYSFENVSFLLLFTLQPTIFSIHIFYFISLRNFMWKFLIWWTNSTRPNKSRNSKSSSDSPNWSTTFICSVWELLFFGTWFLNFLFLQHIAYNVRFLALSRCWQLDSLLM